MKYSATARVYLVSRPAVDWEQIAAFPVRRRPSAGPGQHQGR